MAKSRLEKILKATLNLAKYPSIGVLAMTLGCLPSRMISVSEDGRYAAIPVNSNGELGIAEKDGNNSFMIVLDTKTREVYNFGSLADNQVDYTLLLTNTSDKVAFITKKNQEGESRVVLLRKDSNDRVIKNANFPNLSGDGKFLAYTKIDRNQVDSNATSKRSIPNLELVMLNLSTNEEKIVAKDSFFADFSPDGKKISYFELERQSGENKFFLVLNDLVMNSRKRVYEINEKDIEGLWVPYWVDNDRVLFKTTSQYRKTPEVYLAHADGKIEQVTNNELEENAESFSRRGVFYVADAKVNDSTETYIFKSEFKEGVWQQKNTGRKARYLTAAGDNLIYVGVGKDSNSERTATLYMCSVDSVDSKTASPLNLSELIKKALEKKVKK
jgi:hypothetical protein